MVKVEVRFLSEAECKAYLKGVEDTVGWMAVRIIVRDANGSIVFKFED